MNELEKLLDNILPNVEKPGRYIGNEINMVKKNISETDTRFALCFPDVYEVGMSHLGLQILYFFLNSREDVYCQRAFAPWADMEEKMRLNKIPLYSLESFEPVAGFDFLGFTLQYELCYTNIINMLDLAGIPLLAADRGESFPIVCAGGPCAYNPEPLADIIDFFYLGEAEASLGKVMDIYSENKKNGGNKASFLEKLLSVDGIYVPRFYDIEYKSTGEISSFTANNPNAPAVVMKVVADEIYKLEKQLVPLIEVLHDRVTLEVFRGCSRSCRFCQAGYVYRPVREKSVQELMEQAESLVSATGYEEISLLSLSTGDYSGFGSLASGLLEMFKDKKVNLSLPSLRIDAFTLELMEKAKEVRRSSLTFAPEAGSQRLRDVINKKITEDEILNGCAMAYKGGWDRVKLYFMVGLPTENEEDLKAIGELAGKIVDEYYNLSYEQRKRPLSVTLSASCFVPKALTPFQWEAQDDSGVFADKQRIVKKSITKKQVKFNYHDSRQSIIEGVLARGDRRICRALIKVWQMGARFDGWSEFFSYELWERAFAEEGLDIGFYAFRERPVTEILPWDHISAGVSKEFLISEMLKARAGEATGNCLEGCSGCGAAIFEGGLCVGK